MKICNGCNKTYESKDSRSKFCSRSCSVSFNNRKKISNKLCLYCKNDFKPRLSVQIYCSPECGYNFKKSEKIQKILTGELQSFRIIKQYLIELNNTCSICHMEPIWNNKPLKFILDHIDGNPSNNNLENLRLVCHNCDSQLDTYKGKNAGNGRFSRRERYQNGQSF